LRIGLILRAPPRERAAGLIKDYIRGYRLSREFLPVPNRAKPSVARVSPPAPAMLGCLHRDRDARPSASRLRCLALCIVIVPEILVWERVRTPALQSRGGLRTAPPKPCHGRPARAPARQGWPCRVRRCEALSRPIQNLYRGPPQLRSAVLQVPSNRM